MLVFIVPLKSIQASNSWQHVSNLFERCVKSICNQTSTNFKVIVVCHEKPIVSFDSPHIKYIEVKFPPPQILDIRNKDTDKFRKIATGIKAAQEFAPSHVMIVDADDCVSRHLAEFIDKNSQSNGWFINQGYEYEANSKIIYFRNKNFYFHCGTANIVKYEFCKFPENEDYENMDYKSLFPYTLPHRETLKFMAEKGAPIQPLPFPGAIYIIKHGENILHRQKKLITALKSPQESMLLAKELLRKVATFKILTNSIRQEFSLYNVSIDSDSF